MSGGGDYRTPSSEVSETVVQLGKPLEDGYFRVTNNATAPQGRCVTVLSGYRWTSPQRLREAAAVLEGAADWLEAPAPADDGQLSLDDFREEATHG